jgi:hypothetical protein
VVPVTGLGVTAAATAIVGAASVTVTAADPVTEPLVAMTIAVPALPGAVYRPEPSINPTPAATAHANAGWLDIATPNWSWPVAANGCVPFSFSDAVAGVTVIDVSV